WSINSVHSAPAWWVSQLNSRVEFAMSSEANAEISDGDIARSGLCHHDNDIKISTTRNPTTATNTTHLNDVLTSASMSFLDLSNRSIRRLPVYAAGAGSLQFITPPVPFSI
ncbi:MAG TPA: hypothetical protein VE177_00885, partial [Candidatus Binatus sp.]|nr:hypothetical protein [Candidatus Binatus sp.]